MSIRSRLGIGTAMKEHFCGSAQIGVDGDDGLEADPMAQDIILRGSHSSGFNHSVG